MAKRFDMYCPIAHALSLVGERWALLVVRELLRGPKRYTDLAAGLPGIGTNVLARPARGPPGNGHHGPPPPPARARGRRRHPPPQAAAAGRLDRLRAHRV